VFGGVFVVAGLGVSFWCARGLLLARESTAWPGAPGVILSSEVVEERMDDGTRYHAEISYRFEVEGTTYVGDEVSFADPSATQRQRASRVVAEYPPGGEVTVYYRPGVPETSVLEPGIKPGAWRLLMVGPYLLAVGLGLSLVAPRFLKGRRGRG